MKLSYAIDRTRRLRVRQYPHRKVGSLDFKYIPQSKQLFIGATAFAIEKGGKRQYKMSVSFNQLSSSFSPDKKHKLPYNPKESQAPIYLQQPTVNSNIGLRCQCADFYFMWQYYDKQRKALIGPHKPYIRKTLHYPPKNPAHEPGLCKHLLGLVKIMMDNGIIKKNVKVSQYLNRPRRVKKL